MDVDFVKYLSGKSSKLLKVKHHDIPIMKCFYISTNYIIDIHNVRVNFFHNRDL